MIVFKRRLLFWLIRAYIRKWGKVIILSFLAGCLIFFILSYSSSYLLRLIPIQKNTTIGVSGLYTTDSLPPFILSSIAQGLTTINPDGTIHPGIAQSWDIRDNGHTYIFHIDPKSHFSDGKQVEASDVNFNFSNVHLTRPDSKTIVYHLPEVYAPFLVTVSRPILRNAILGTGEYKITNFEVNGAYWQSFTLVSVKNRFETKKYYFYSNTDIVKTAFLLGEVSDITMLPDTTYNGINLATFPNTKVVRTTQYGNLVTLFYNTQDQILSDNQVRSALGYAIRNSFPQGERAYFPYPPNVWYADNTLTPKQQDFTHAQLLLKASNQQILTLSLKTQRSYDVVAHEIANDFKKIGINTKIEDVDYIPSQFQLYIGTITLPKDPDQYSLWHEKEPNNISLLIDKRIDKYLEDGRQTIDPIQRKLIYNDFQKYLIERAPATFLFFPYVYDIVRK